MLSWRIRIVWHLARERFTLKAASLGRRWYFNREDRHVRPPVSGEILSDSELNVAPRQAASRLTTLFSSGPSAAMSLWVALRRRRYPPDAGQDQIRYERWLIARGEQVRLPSRAIDEMALPGPRRESDDEPLFSVVVPVFRPPLWGLERCITSVLSQSFDDFEVRLCDDCGGDGEVLELLRRCEALDSRVQVIVSDHNEGIANTTNRALAASTGRYVIFLDHDDELADGALGVIAAVIRARPEADVLYSDSDKISADGNRFAPAFKPAWSPDLLCSGMYIGHVLVVRRSLVEKVGGLRSIYDGSQDHNLALRVTEIAGSVVHIPRILYHWRSGPGSAAANPFAKPWAREAGRSAVAEALQRRGEPATVEHDPRAIGRYHCSRVLVPGTVVTIALVRADLSLPLAGGRVVRDLVVSERELVATAGMPVDLVGPAPEGGDWELSWTSRASAALRAARTDLVVLLDPRLLPLSRQWARGWSPRRSTWRRCRRRVRRRTVPTCQRGAGGRTRGLSWTRSRGPASDSTGLSGDGYRATGSVCSRS